MYKNRFCDIDKKECVGIIKCPRQVPGECQSQYYREFSDLTSELLDKEQGKIYRSVRPVFSKSEVLKHGMIVELSEKPLDEYRGIRANIWEVSKLYAEIKEGNWIIDDPNLFASATQDGFLYRFIRPNDVSAGDAVRAVIIERVYPGVGIITGIGNEIRWEHILKEA